MTENQILLLGLLGVGAYYLMQTSDKPTEEIGYIDYADEEIPDDRQSSAQVVSAPSKPERQIFLNQIETAFKNTVITPTRPEYHQRALARSCSTSPGTTSESWRSCRTSRAQPTWWPRRAREIGFTYQPVRTS